MKRVALVTSSMKGMPARLIDSERISVIPNGLDVNVIQKLSGLNLSEPFNSFIKNHDPVILAVGRLAKEKRFNCVINALKVIKRKNITAGVIIVGEAGLRDSLNELVNSLGLEGDVLMPGYTKHVPALLRHCDFLLMPSKTEGLPITLLEAIAVKIPVISTPVGEIPVVLGHEKGGWIINDADAVTIASTVNELAENPDICIAKAKWAYENLLEFYSAKRMAENYDLFYKKALDQA
jgi:glycosyltransferase involved in cell wall biosynthesis